VTYKMRQNLRAGSSSDRWPLQHKQSRWLGSLIPFRLR